MSLRNNFNRELGRGHRAGCITNPQVQDCIRIINSPFGDLEQVTLPWACEGSSPTDELGTVTKKSVVAEDVEDDDDDDDDDDAAKTSRR